AAVLLGSPATFGEHIAAETEKWARVIHASAIERVCAAVTNWAMERRRGAGAGGVKTVQWLGWSLWGAVGMFAVGGSAAVRRFGFVEGNSRREAARVFGLSRETVLKMCRFSLPPGYTRTRPVTKPKLGPLLAVIDAILEADRTGPVKQRHTAKRIFERLRD